MLQRASQCQWLQFSQFARQQLHLTSAMLMRKCKSYHSLRLARGLRFHQSLVLCCNACERIALGSGAATVESELSLDV
jgi:hypothetical protein